ncbi:hypothetical protein [Agrococcus casei]|uniref:hypothetical protein n=1 Tax=Agrococcus casei TaxID=343512 RepID=UPI003F8DBDF5
MIAADVDDVDGLVWPFSAQRIDGMSDDASSHHALAETGLISHEKPASAPVSSRSDLTIKLMRDVQHGVTLKLLQPPHDAFSSRRHAPPRFVIA